MSLNSTPNFGEGPRPVFNENYRRIAKDHEIANDNEDRRYNERYWAEKRERCIKNGTFGRKPDNTDDTCLLL